MNNKYGNEKVGILISHLGASQLAYNLLMEGHRYYEDGTADIVVFFQNNVRNPITPPFANMSIAEAYGFNGHVVATDFQTAQLALTLPAPKSRNYYCWDLEWFTKPTNFKSNLEVFTNDNLNIIVRSLSHNEIILKIWGKQSTVIEDFNLLKLTNYLENK